MTSHSGAADAPRMLKSQAVADAVRQRAIAGEWAVGDRLPTERELAAEHGIGINTVRRAVSQLVREGTVRKIQGSGTYLVSVPAPSGRGGARPLIGVVLPTPKYYAGITDGIIETLRRAGWQVLISYATFEPELELERCQELLALGARGLLLSPSFYASPDPEAHLFALESLGVPVVLVDRRPPTRAAERSSYVATDRECAAQIAVRRFVQIGRTRIGYFGTFGATSSEVHDAFGPAVTSFGLSLIGQAVQERRPWTRDDVAAYVEHCRAERIDAVLCMDDRKALVLLPALAEAGLRVPEDVAVIAYDDSVYDLATVSLSTISPPRFEVGAAAAELVLHHLTQGVKAAARHIEMQPRLIVRASCAVDPADLVHRAVLDQT